MRALLDTETCLRLLCGDAHVRGRINETGVQDVVVSAITWGELLYGIKQSPSAMQVRRQSRQLLALKEELAVLPITPHVGSHYAALRTHLRAAKRSVGGNALWLAAHAMSLHARFITRQARSFAGVQGLKAESWYRSAVVA